MASKSQKTLSLFAGCAAASFAGAAASETVLLLTKNQASCIASNIPAYLETGSDPVVVVPKTCPNPPTNDDIMAALAPQNSGTGMPVPRVGESDAVLVLLKSELECFGRLFTAGDVVQTQDGFISVSLDSCAE